MMPRAVEEVDWGGTMVGRGKGKEEEAGSSCRCVSSSKGPKLPFRPFLFPSFPFSSEIDEKQTEGRTERVALGVGGGFRWRICCINDLRLPVRALSLNAVKKPVSLAEEEEEGRDTWGVWNCFASLASALGVVGG